jgi:hypothetical protein
MADRTGALASRRPRAAWPRRRLTAAAISALAWRTTPEHEPPRNVELVEQLAELITASGRTIATVEETHQILGIPVNR